MEDAEYDGEDEERVRTAPFLAVEAAALPRNAEVEWVAEWDVPEMLQDDEDDEEDERSGFGEDETWVRSTTGALNHPFFHLLRRLGQA